MTTTFLVPAVRDNPREKISYAFENENDLLYAMPRLFGDGGHDSGLTLPGAQRAFLDLLVRRLDPSGSPAYVDASKAGYAPRRKARIPPGANAAIYEEIWNLDRSALDDCIGGGFSPGIEASINILDLTLFSEPFRLHSSQLPGVLNSTMAVPWHADFHDCADVPTDSTLPVIATYFWWPSHRPIDSASGPWFSGTMEEMAEQWPNLEEIL